MFPNTPDWDCVGDRVLTGMIKANRSLRELHLIRLCPNKKRSGHRHAQRDDHVRTQGEDVYTSPGERCHRNQPCDTLILDFGLPGLRGHKFPWLKPPSVVCPGKPICWKACGPGGCLWSVGSPPSPLSHMIPHLAQAGNASKARQGRPCFV